MKYVLLPGVDATVTAICGQAHSAPPDSWGNVAPTSPVADQSPAQVRQDVVGIHDVDRDDDGGDRRGEYLPRTYTDEKAGTLASTGLMTATGDYSLPSKG